MTFLAPLLALVECVNLHWLLDVGLHAARGPRQRPYWSRQDGGVGKAGTNVGEGPGAEDTPALFTAVHHIHSFFLDSFPKQVITECVVEFPVVYSRFLLIICWASLCADTVLDAENVMMKRTSP